VQVAQQARGHDSEKGPFLSHFKAWSAYVMEEKSFANKVTMLSKPLYDPVITFRNNYKTTIHILFKS
jgi:hypothetical protein